MSERSLVDEWLRVHRALMVQEAEFTALALKAAEGGVPEDELDRERAKLLAMRELCNTVYSRAFPQATGKHSAG
jgi:hypothetical protein